MRTCSTPRINHERYRKIPPQIKHISEARENCLRSSDAAAQSQFSASKSEPNERNLRRQRLSSSSSSASAIFVFANEDLLRKILLRLPPKPLLRFQCVSKQWLSIISDPNFRLLHCRQYPTRPSSPAVKGLFLFRRDDGRINFMSFHKDDAKSMGIITSRFNSLRYTFLSPKIVNHNTDDIHACNGLLCIRYRYDIEVIFVYNPTTDEHRVIRHPPQSSVALNIVFDPLKSKYYKLAQVWSKYIDFRTSEYGFSIYSSETGVWRDLRETIDENCRLNLYKLSRGVLYNGELHWVCSQSSISFDLSKERLNSTPYRFPAKVCDKYSIKYFAACGGCLLAMKFNEDQKKLNVLQFKKDYSRWIMNYDVDLAPLFSSYLLKFHTLWNAFEILYYSEKEGKGKVVILLSHRVISYDISGMIDTEIAEVDYRGSYYYNRGTSEVPVDTYYEWKQAHQHIETLSTV